MDESQQIVDKLDIDSISKGILIKRSAWHYIIWPIITILVFISGLRIGVEYSIYNCLLFVPAIAIICYTNIYILIPKLFVPPKKKRNIYYISAALLLLIVMVYTFASIDIKYLSPYIQDKVQEEFSKRDLRLIKIIPITRYAVSFLLTLFISTLYTITELAKGKVNLWKQLQSEKVEMELKFLKSQINPHFLFNALNSIYTKVYIKDDDAADSVLTLAEMFRYILDDSSRDTAPLLKEIHYIENYIDFIKMKSEETQNICFTQDCDNNSLPIAPLLLLPIIENCFKHSRVDFDPDATVKIDISERDGVVILKTENTIYGDRTPHPLKKEESERIGIGIENLKKRLTISYPESHSFQIEERDNTYYATLQIDTNREE